MKNLFKKAVVILLALAMLLGMGSTAGRTVEAAGTVNVEEYDYNDMYDRLAQAFPSIFSYIRVRDTVTGEELRADYNLRFAIGGDTPIAKNIDGTWAPDQTPGSMSFSSFNSDERFTVNGNVAYCFDWLTAAGNSSFFNAAYSSLEEAGINVYSNQTTMDVAKAAEALTKNNFALITNNADAIAKAFTSPYNSSKSYDKNTVASVLKSTGQDATAFKRMLVQAMVWNKMNQIKLLDAYPSFTPSADFIDKEGNTHYAANVLVEDTIGVPALFDLEQMFQIGRGAFEAAGPAQTETFRRQYELEVDKAFTVPAADVGIVRAVMNANGGKVEASGNVTAKDNGTTITLTATKAIPSWTEWLSATVPMDAIYAAKPYVQGNKNGGQFIVDPNGVSNYYVRVKADKQDAFDPLGNKIFAQKRDSQTTANSAQGGASLQGAIFTVKLFGNETATGTPISTWTFKTDASGAFKFNDTYKVSGPALPKDALGNTGIPAGHSVTMQETTSPAGYLVNNAVTKIAFLDNGDGTVSKKNLTNNQTIAANAPQLALVDETVQKIAIKVSKESNAAMAPGTTLDGISFAIVNRNAGSIRVGNKDVARGQIVAILTIKGAGNSKTASVTSEKLFPIGNYDIYELQSNHSYAVGVAYGSSSPNHGDSGKANADFKYANNKRSVEITQKDVDAGVAMTPEAATNAPAPKYFDVTVKKVDNAGKAVAGATFNLKYDGKDHVATTGTNGMAVWKNILWKEEGVPATLIETKAPAGYQIDPAYAAPGKNYTLKANPGATFDLGTVTNAALVSATLKKVDDAGQPIAGVVFNLKYDNADHKKTTGADGTATWTGIISGTKATLIEESVPDGYEKDPVYANGKAVTITANAGTTYNLGTITNTTQLGKVQVKKAAAKVENANETKVDLSGFTFRLTGTSLLGKAVNMTAVTNADGIALFENVPFGNNYSVKEELTNAQKAIWKAADDMPVTVSATAMGNAGYVPVNVTNTPIPGSLTIVKVVPEGEKTRGAGFNFLISGTSDAGYTYSQTVTTDATGKVTVNGIPYGTYSVEEKLTAEQQKVWETKSADSVTINAQKKEVTFTLIQTEKTTQVTLKKVSEDGKVEGFKFTITGTRSIGGSFTKSGTTDAKGEIDFGMVPYGNYTVEENLTAAQKLIYGEPTINPKSFTLSDENQTQGIVATAKNELIRGQIKVVKTDKETGNGSVQGNASLEGIKFAIVNRTGETAFLPNGSEIADGAIAAILSTDKKGEAATPAEYLQMGKYEVVELRKDSVFNVGDAYDAKAENAGESILANDSYLFAEQKQPATLAYKGTPNPTVDMAYSDTVVKGGVSIVKKDAELADGAQGNGSLAGIRFAIINTSKEKVLVGGVVIEPNQIAAIITTNAEGKAECTANLPYGTYKLVELWVNSGAAKGEALPALPTGDGILANDSYLWDKNEQTITLTENGVVKAAEKDATNRVVEGHIKVVKVDEETEETQGDTSLADIYFAIVNDSANTVMIGTTRVEKGAVAAVVRTNEKGECETGELPYGSYTVYEMRMDAERQGIIGKAWADVEKGTSVYANASYLWAENKQPMSVTKHNEIKVTPKETNKPVPGSLEIIKTDAEMTATQGDAVLTGIKYAIVNMSAKAVKVNGTLYPVGQIVEIVTLNAEGKAYSSSLPYGTYRIVELRQDNQFDLGDIYDVNAEKAGKSTYANDSYQWSEQSRTQTVRENGKQYTVEYENIPTKGKASVTKTDTENMTPEGDATFEGIRYAVINRSFSAVMIGETKVEKGAVAAVVILDKNGKATTAENLPYGTYDVVELRRDAVAKIGEVLVEGESIYANASYLYKNQVKPIKVREEGKVYETSFDNTPVKGGISLEKKDDKHDTAQGDASLAGIRFAIVNRSAKEVWVKGVKVEKNAVAAVLTTDKDGKAKTGNMDLPYGTYEVIELRMDAAGFEVGTMWNDVVKGESIYANASYLYKAFSQTVKTRIHGEIVPCEVPFTNPVVRGGVSITKRDFYTDDIPQGDAGFIGVRYAVINRSAEEVLLPDGTVIPKDAVALVLSADKDGKAQSSAKALAYGTYDVIELRIDSVAEIGKEVVMGSHEMANYSYLWKELVHRIEVREEGKIYEATKDGKVFENEPEEPKNPELFKYDLDLGTNKTQGGASFEGIRFALINRSANPVFVEHFEKLFVPGQVIDVIKSTAEGIIELPYTMSYGTYGLMELSTLSTVKQGDMFDEISDIVKYGVSEDRIGQLYANASYMYTDREEKTFKAITRADGHVEYDTSLLHFDNKVVRAGIYFEKKIESTQEHLPYVVFKVTLKETGETHYIMTNHNAYYGTDQLYNLHSNNTNGIDAIVKPYAEEGFIPQAIIDELIAKEAWNWGTWFGTSPIHDDEYALPFGSYDMEEIKSPANEKYFMYRNDDFKIWYNYQYHSFGTIFNREMGILTSAVDAGTNTREGFATKNAKILDTVTYNGLVPGASYELVATLMAKNAEGKWEQIKGIEVHKTFIPKVENHYEVMEIVFDATPYENADVVVFEELRDANGAVIAEHKSLTDAKQTVSYRPLPVSSMTIVKEEISTGAHDGKYWDGEVVRYRITVTNTGETTLDNIIVTDAKLDFESTIARLLPGKSASFVVSYEVTKEDAKAGTIHNVATAETEDPTDPTTTITVEDEEDVSTGTPKREMTIEKKEISSSKHEKGYWAGEVVKYKITVTNTGEAALEDIEVTDAKLDFEDTIARLLPGKSKSFTVEYVVTAADAKAGTIHNVATAKTTWGPDPEDTITVEDTEDVPAYEPEVGLAIAKVAVTEPANGIAYMIGETVKYKITVTNPGEVTLEEVEVTDEKLGFEDFIAILRPGKSRDFFVTYTITEEDVKAGQFVNVATATCDDPTSTTEDPKDPLTSTDDEDVPTMEFLPGYEQNKVEVSKPKNGIAYVEGETIIFKLSLNNTGNQPLTITVKDELVGFEADVFLNPGETWEKEVAYMVTLADAEAGHVLNVLTSTGIPPVFPPLVPPTVITPPPSEVDPPTMIEDPSYEQNKIVVNEPKNGIAFVEGETIIFKISLKNTGNLPLVIEVKDELIGFADTVKLPIDGTWEAELSYVVTRADAEAGHVLNVLTSEGEPDRPEDYPGPEDPPILIPPVEVDPPTMIEDPRYEQTKVVTSKSAHEEGYLEGETVTYKLTVKNTGNLPLTIVVKDELVGLEETITLAIGAEWEKEVSYTVTRADVEKGFVLNVLTSEGTPVRPEEWPDDPDQPITPPPVEVEVPAIKIGTVTVIYVDETGKVLIEKEIVLKDAPEGTPYVTEEKQIEHYRFKEMDPKSAPKTGEVVEGTQEVIYVYEQIIGDVIVKFVDRDGNEIIPTETVFKDAPEGTPYETEKKDIPSWRFVEIREDSDPEKGEVREGTTTVIYVYEPIIGDVIVKFVDKDGKEIIPTETLLKDAPEGTPYETEKKDIPSWRFVEIHKDSDPEKGEVREGTTTVIYVYEPVIGTITIEFKDEDGNTISETIIHLEDVPEGTPYEVTPIEIPGYRFEKHEETSAPQKGEVPEGISTVVYIYKQIVGDVVVKYVDKDGNELIPGEIVKKDAPEGEEYSTSSKEIPGYRFVEIHKDSAPEKGKVTEGTTTVIYVYEPVIVTGTVIVKHITTDGKTLKEEVALKDMPVGTAYVTTIGSFDGYKFVKVSETSAPTSGEVVEGTLYVIYVYDLVKSEVPDKGDMPDTGDYTNLLIPALAMGSSALALCGVAFAARRKKEDEVK